MLGNKRLSKLSFISVVFFLSAGGDSFAQDEPPVLFYLLDRIGSGGK